MGASSGEGERRLAAVAYQCEHPEHRPRATHSPQRLWISCDVVMFGTNETEPDSQHPGEQRQIWRQMRVGVVAWQNEKDEWHKQMIWGQEDDYQSFGASLYELACRCGYHEAEEKLPPPAPSPPAAAMHGGNSRTQFVSLLQPAPPPADSGRFTQSELARLLIDHPCRRVEIRRGYLGPGERTDIYVTATIEGSHDVLRTIVEVKGCWHVELQTAMQTQLKDRYLHENDCNRGIYLVGWFACEEWNQKDHRKQATPKWTLETARQSFQDQAIQVSEPGAQLRGFVLDSSLK